MPNSKTPSKIGAIINCKCPRCRTGRVFKFPLYKITKYNVMHPDCPVCGLHYEIEPGYFYTAMYISYMLTSALTIILGFSVYYLLHDPDLWVYSIVIIGSLIFLSPISLRYSRMLALHVISPIKFDKKYLPQN